MSLFRERREFTNLEPVPIALVTQTLSLGYNFIVLLFLLFYYTTAFEFIMEKYLFLYF